LCPIDDLGVMLPRLWVMGSGSIAGDGRCFDEFLTSYWPVLGRFCAGIRIFWGWILRGIEGWIGLGFPGFFEYPELRKFGIIQ
jgi:hypothetical protein